MRGNTAGYFVDGWSPVLIAVLTVSLRLREGGERSEERGGKDLPNHQCVFENICICLSLTGINTYELNER